MARTLAELTLKLSQDLSALEAACTRQMDELEEARDLSLMAIGFASQVLKNYNQGLERAKAAQMKAIQEANEIRDKEIHAAEDKRRGELAGEERKHGEAKTLAFRKREVNLRKAKAAWKAAVEKVRQHPLSEQRALRKAADKAYEAAVEKAEEAYHDAIDDARLALQSALQEILADERMAFVRANRTAERMRTAAVVAYERAVAVEEARMRSELAANPEARRIQESYDRRFVEARQSCERKKEALFRKFTQDRKNLKNQPSSRAPRTR